MSYELQFIEDALSEWKRLDGSVRDHFKKKIAERLNEPRIPSAKLFGHPDRYKIKLRAIGYRLVYEVQDKRLVVLVIAVGKRDRNAVYRVANMR